MRLPAQRFATANFNEASARSVGTGVLTLTLPRSPDRCWHAQAKVREVQFTKVNGIGNATTAPGAFTPSRKLTEAFRFSGYDGLACCVGPMSNATNAGAKAVTLWAGVLAPSLQ